MHFSHGRIFRGPSGRESDRSEYGQAVEGATVVLDGKTLVADDQGFSPSPSKGGSKLA